MGVGRSAPISTYSLAYSDPEPGGPVQNSRQGKAATRLKAKAHAASKRSNVSPAGAEEAKSSDSGKPSQAKLKLRKAKNMIAAQRAFADAGSARESRRSSKHGWIAKDMMLGSGCSLKKFELNRVIGMGLMGTVRLAKFKKDGTWCVLKAIRKDYVTRHNDGRHVQNEKNILIDLDHPFIVELFGTFQDPKRIFFVMEYVAGGELFSRLRKKDAFAPSVAKFYLAEILLALQYIHESGYAYRDLKPENILLDEEGHCKVVDFGFSRACGTTDMMKTNVGTPAYLSPEQLNGKFTNGYSRIIDWWSFGIITYELMTGKTPFCRSRKDSSYAIYTRVLKGRISFPGKFDKVGKDMVKQLLTADTSKRLVDPNQIRLHAFLSEINFDAVYERRAIPPHRPKIEEEGDAHYFDEYPDLPDSDNNAPIDDSLFSGF